MAFYSYLSTKIIIAFITKSYQDLFGVRSYINAIFKQWTSDTSVGYTCAKRILEIPAHSTVRNDDGFPNWSHRVGSIGNAVNPTVAKYLFECIKIFDKQ